FCVHATQDTLGQALRCSLKILRKPNSEHTGHPPRVGHMSTIHASGIQAPQVPHGSHHAPPQKDESVKKSFNASSLLFAFSFGVYLVLLVMMTLLKSRLSLGGLWNTEAHQYRSIDLELFNGFIDPPIWW